MARGLLDARRLVKRAVLYGVLAAFIGAVYVTVVVGIGRLFGTGGRPNRALTIAATVLVAVAFQGARVRAERLSNRLAYGERVTPFEALSTFSRRAAATNASEEALLEIARVVAEGTGAGRVELWLRVGDDIVRATSWPDRGPAVRLAVEGEAVPSFGEAFRAVDVRYRGELLGAIAVAKRPGEPLTPREEGLLADLAGAAALLLRNVRLTAELGRRLSEREARAAEVRASRQRIVAAQDAERRRIMGDIHDGAQQHLVALAVHVGLARSLAASNPEGARGMVADIRRMTGEALETLQDLSRGIYPPVLLEQGLAAALRAQARKLDIPVSVEAEGVPRCAPEVEAAVYFSCTEALQNAAKHARGSGVSVLLRESGGELLFEVNDEGPGFDPAAVARGAGSQNMTDRVAALGGALEVRSSLGAGTTVTGRIPVRVEETVG